MKQEQELDDAVSEYFTFGDANRSERAKQVDLLVPALGWAEVRERLLRLVPTGDEPGIDAEESAQARVWHFVWVLRDSFTADRDACSRKDWDRLRQRWCAILALPEWADEPGWWRHPEGSYRKSGEPEPDPGFMVHPCHRTIGWTEKGLKARAEKFDLTIDKTISDTLIRARQVMNTECDCFIQTPKRLIVVECKDKSAFESQQAKRQIELCACLQRLLPRPLELQYIELAGNETSHRVRQVWNWEDLAKWLST